MLDIKNQLNNKVSKVKVSWISLASINCSMINYIVLKEKKCDRPEKHING